MDKITTDNYLAMAHCERRSYLSEHKPREAVIDAETQLINTQLEDALVLARELFPNSQVVHGETLNERIAHTEKLLAGGCSTIFNAHIEANGLVAIVNILNHNLNWEMITLLPMTMRDIRDFIIKDTAEAEFKFKLKGIAFNQKILEAKFPGQKCTPYAMGINSSYVRIGDLVVESVFEKANLEGKLATFATEIEENLISIKNQKEDPMTMVGSHCKNPICPFKAYCWTNLGEDSIHNIPRISPKKREEFISKGWNKVTEIPEANLATDLTDIQRGAVKNIKNGRVLKNPMKLAMFLNRLTYPIYYFDFEAFQPMIPQFENSKAFDMIPFQYSLHIEERVGRDIVLSHKGYLHTEKTDPRRQIAERMLEDLKDKGSIMVYNKTFEAGVIEYLATLYPDLAENLRRLLSRLVDLMVPFKEQQFFHPKMGFSYSLKAVQPALVPDLSYKGQVIEDGAQAMKAYWEILETKDEVRKQVLIKGLEDYCAMDTIVMVKIIEVLKAR